MQFGLGRRPVFKSQHHKPQRVVPNEHAGVDSHWRERIEVLGKAHLPEWQPRRASTQIVGEGLSLSGQHRRDREPAMADDLGSDALPNLALRSWIDRQDEIGVGLDVDKARRHGEAVSIDDSIGISGQARTERRNAARIDGDVTDAAGSSAPID